MDESLRANENPMVRRHSISKFKIRLENRKKNTKIRCMHENAKLLLGVLKQQIVKKRTNLNLLAINTKARCFRCWQFIVMSHNIEKLERHMCYHFTSRDHVYIANICFILCTFCICSYTRLG